MNAAAIVYTSQTGFTARYAALLAERTGLPCRPLKEAAALPRGTAVIYLGWLCAGGIKGLKGARRRFRTAAVCAVGMAAEVEEAKLRRDNRLEGVPLFYLRGGYAPEKLTAILDKVGDGSALVKTTQFGSCVFANKPGDGSAREQAASCQKVLGGFANICYEFATKRYRSNCINWGILPFTLDADTSFDYAPGDCVFVPGIRQAIENGIEDIPARVIRTDGAVEGLMLHVKGLTDDEKEIILDGCLMNYYAKRN